MWMLPCSISSSSLLIFSFSVATFDNVDDTVKTLVCTLLRTDVFHRHEFIVSVMGFQIDAIPHRRVIP